MFPLLQYPVVACFTPSQQTFGIAYGDVRLVSICSDMENPIYEAPDAQFVGLMLLPEAVQFQNSFHGMPLRG